MLRHEQGVRSLVLLAFVLAHAVLSLRWYHAARRLVTLCFEKSDAEEEDTASTVAKAAADAVQQRKASVRRILSIILSHVASLLVVVFTCMHIFWEDEDGDLWSAPAFATVCTVYFLLLLFMHYPGERSWQSSRLAILAAAITCQGLSHFSQGDLVSATIFRFAVATPLRVVGSIVALDTPFICVYNAVSSVLFGIAIFRIEDLEVLPGSRVQICLADLVATLFIAASSRAFEHYIITSCRYAIELKASKSEAYAMAKVLHKVCDAVVHLDEDLRVAVADSSLAALLQHGRGCIQVGTDFLQYLHYQEERWPLRDWLKASHNPCEDHVTFETRLRDSIGSAIAVEMFNVPFETITGASRNFLGIREKVLPDNAHPHAGHGRLNEDGLAALRGFAGTPRRPRRSPRRARSSPAASTSPATSERSSSGSSDTRPRIQEIDACPVFQFDAATLDILDYSPGFTFGSHRPPPRGSNLLSELPACDVNKGFLSSYDECASDTIQRSRAALQRVVATFDSAMVFECSGVRFRVQVAVKMEADWEPGADPQDPEQLPTAVCTAKVLSVIRDQDCSEGLAASTVGRPVSL